MTLERAIEKLAYWYSEAIKNEHIRNKVAWALYQTWKEADKCTKQ